MRSPSGHHLAVSVCATALLVSCSSPDTPATTTGSTPAADATATSATASPTATPTASSTPTTAASTARPTSPTRRSSTTEVIAVSLKSGKVKPAVERVEIARGARVSLKVTSDVADEVHVHGYDRFADLKPNRTTTLSFKATQKGLFEVEAENTATVLVRLLVR